MEKNEKLEIGKIIYISIGSLDECGLEEKHTMNDEEYRKKGKESDEIKKLLNPIIGKLISEDNYEIADKIMDMIYKNRMSFEEKSGEIISFSGESEARNYRYNFSKNRKIFFKLKYLGNGIFEETASHEKIQACSTELHIHYPNYKTSIIQIGNSHIIKPIVLDYKDYLDTNKMLNKNFEYGNKYMCDDPNFGKVLSKTQYINELQILSKNINEYPLKFSGYHILDSTIFDTYEDAKKDYQNVTDEERKEFIHNYKKLLNKDIEKLNYRITLSELSVKCSIISDNKNLSDIENENKIR